MKRTQFRTRSNPPNARLCSVQSFMGALAALSAVAAWAAEVGPPAPNPQAVREVAEGKRAVAHAAWWGFDEQDSTAALQAAIRSGATKVVVENMGRPWIVDKIELAGHQEVVFENGVVVLAKRGAFRGKGDSLFTASLKTNVTLTGYGATLKMWKQDYDSSDYEKAEWRHALSIRSCARVRISGLTLADSGGDGIYLGVARKGVSNTDVEIRDVVCANNYRQGISVISADGLLLENCVLKDTGGTAPQAGIDFEPNHPDEKLVDCVMRNCVSENNRGDGFEFYLKNLSATSAPISIRLENCRTTGDRRSVSIGTGNSPEQSAVQGTIEFRNCRFEKSAESAISIRGKPATGGRVRFINCVITDPATQHPDRSPILLGNAADDTERIGGIDFVDCVLRDPLNRPPMAYQDVAGLKVTDVTGTLLIERGGLRTSYPLDQRQIDTWLPHQAFKEVPPFKEAGVGYEPISTGIAKRADLGCEIRQRGTAAWLLWARAGDAVTFTVRIQPVGRTAPSPAAVRVLAPSGREQRFQPAPGGQVTSYSFAPTETGAHRIVCEAGNATAQVDSRTVPVCLYAAGRAFHLLGSTGEFRFWIPAGVREFALRIIGGGGAERVKAALHDSAGNLVQERDNIELAQQFYVARSEAAPGEIWNLRVARPSTGVLEDYFVHLQGLPPVLACSKENLLRPSDSKKQP